MPDVYKQSMGQDGASRCWPCAQPVPSLCRARGKRHFLRDSPKNPMREALFLISILRMRKRRSKHFAQVPAGAQWFSGTRDLG